MIRTLHEGLLADGIAVPLTKLCAWFGVPRRTVYYKPTKATPKIDPRFAEPIKAMIEKEPSFGYRTVAWLLGFNKNTVQRIFQLKGWQVRKRPIGMRPRIEAVPSVANAPNERWSTDLWPASCLPSCCLSGKCTNAPSGEQVGANIQQLACRRNKYGRSNFVKFFLTNEFQNITIEKNPLSFPSHHSTRLSSELLIFLDATSSLSRI